MPAILPLRILVAEDTAANQKVIAAILRQRGHFVEIARNGRDAVELARRQPFDVILMDVQMPVMDGYEATESIRHEERSAGRRTPIVALTANNSPEDRQRCLLAEMDECIAKPIDSRRLVEAVEQFAAAVSPPH